VSGRWEVDVARIIGVPELQRRFEAVLDEVVKDGVPYVLARGSRPEVAIIPYEQFLRYQALDQQAVPDRVARGLARLAADKATLTDEEVAADVAAAIKEARAESAR
jgi:prevent-host-death family protein